MNIFCDKCGQEFCRDVIVEGRIIEEYVNIYGTSCPHCGYVVKEQTKPKFIIENDLKMESLRKQAREILASKIKSKGE